eukprot:COSAG02_NODE_715_length_18086_cov_109.753433_19_plen_190_part_00
MSLPQDIDPATGRTYEEVCRRCHTACGQPHSDGQSTLDQKLACGAYCQQHVPGDKQCTAACDAYDDNLYDGVRFLAFSLDVVSCHCRHVTLHVQLLAGGCSAKLLTCCIGVQGLRDFDQMCSQICEGDNLICHSICDLGPACHGSDKQISCNDCKDDCFSCVDPASGRTALGCTAECTANACGETSPVR